MIRAVSIRRGRSGTWDTLKLIHMMGLEGSKNDGVNQFVMTIPVNQWEAMLRTYWQYQAENQETLRGVAKQVEIFMRTGHMIGDCDDVAVVIAALCISSHLPFKIVAVRRPEDQDFSHVFVEALQFRFDPTAPDNADYRYWERMVYP